MEYALIGEKLGHSFSVPIHNAFGNPDYVLKEIPRDELRVFLEKKDFKGLNVTIPYKQDVMPYCILDEAAKEIGAVNTIVNRNGELYGYNSDAYGLEALLDRTVGEKTDAESAAKSADKDYCLRADLTGWKAVILGAGGTAKTATFVLGKKNVSEITILARDVDKAKKGMKGKPVSFASITEIPEEILEKTDIIINTTPVGMFPNADFAPVNISDFRNLKCVIDVVYNPLTTKLIADAKRAGIPAANGLYMLVMQAFRAEELFFEQNGGIRNGAITGENVLSDLQNQLTNVVLIGMPGCGKSTIGTILAKKLNRELVDTDAAFEETYRMSPAKCIQTEGEEEFRRKETVVVKETGSVCGRIIATGGGVVTRKENIDSLKQNGILVYIKRDVKNLSSDGRPLSQGDGAIERLFEARKKLYEDAADVIVEVQENDAGSTADSICDSII